MKRLKKVCFIYIVCGGPNVVIMHIILKLRAEKQCMRVFRVVSALDPKELCKRLDEIDGIAIRRDMVGSREELDLALHLAESSFSKKTNIARKLRYEFILWLAGRTYIKSAM